MQRVGVIGLGRMGLPIAVNLMERGFEVVGYRRQGSPELAAAGGIVVDSAAAVAERSDVLLSILPDAAALEEVVCGPAGTLTVLRPGIVHIEMSTIDVTRKAAVRDAVRSFGGDLLDCPISGSPGMVKPRRATPFASGNADAIEAVRPVLEAIAGPCVCTGEFGTGTSMKYISSMLLAVHTVAAAEAIVLARRSGLDLELVQNTLDNSIASSAILAQRGPVMRAQDWSAAPGPIETLHAILEQVDGFVGETGLSTTVFASAKAVFDAAIADGWGPLDIASVHDRISATSPAATSTDHSERAS
jgi:L-threonate 2-dehydrogenase